MDNYAYTTSYAESGDSSPRSREIDFENPSPWEDQPQNNYKVKFMCSYGGKIHPRPHDNQLSYVGGETKILAVDRAIKFSGIISKLSALCDADVCFKYQLPGEDLDALISVTNDDDLEHMMNEYDRLFRASAKPARLRLFLFPANSPVPSQSGFGSGEEKSDRERFVDALNSGPIQSSSPPSTETPPPNHMDFLFGLDNKGVPPPPVPVAMKLQDQVLESPCSDRFTGSDPMQRQIQDLQRLHIGGQEQAMYRKKSDDNLVGGFPGEYYVKKMPEKVSPTTAPVSVPAPVSVQAGYWPEKQFVSGGFQPNTAATEQQQVYMISTPAGMYHAPMARPVTAPTGQGYYAVQRMPPDVYRDQQVYNAMQQMAAPPAPAAAPPQPTLQAQQQQQQKVMGYSDGYGMVRQQQTSGGPGVTDMAYAQMAYDSGVGRQVYYTAPGGVMPQGYQAVAVNADMRPGNLSQEGKVVTAKVSQT